MATVDDLIGMDLLAGKPVLTAEQEKYMSAQSLDQYYLRTPVTYGVELQFLIPVLVEGQPDPHPNDGRQVLTVKPGTSHEDISAQVVEAVMLVMRAEARVPVWTYPGPQYLKFNAVPTMDEESQAIVSRPPYSQWTVEAARDLLPFRDPCNKFYTWVGVKVKSNKRNSAVPGHFEPIAKVIVALRQYFRMRLPPTTSLMVHIGENRWDNMVYENCPLWLRVFCTLWWFIESHVFLLIHPSRRRNAKCLPLREHSRLGIMEPEERAETLAKGLQDGPFASLYQQMHYILPISMITDRDEKDIECIWRARDAKTLTQMMLVRKLQYVKMDFTGRILPHGTEGRGSLGFQGSCEGADPTSRRKNNDGESGTIEFRCLEGTLDPEFILNWVAVLIRLFDTARRGNTSEIMAIIARTRGSYGGLSLLRDLGLEEQARYFDEKLGEYLKMPEGVIPERWNNLFVDAYPTP